MPEKSGFFDSTSTDVRTYPARDFADYFAQILTNGVFNGGQYLNPTASGTDATVRISPGHAWINGYVYNIYSTPLSLQIQPAATLPRIDRIILRLDTSLPTRSIRALVLQGTPATNPTAPALTRSGDMYDLSIAQVRVNANSTIISQSNITDERLNNTVCGLVNSLVRVDTAIFQQQWDAFIASVQASGFATPEYVNTKANAAENNAKNYVDEKTWQKYRLTQDNGFVKSLAQNTDLNTLTSAGQYDGIGFRNGPLGSVDGIWFFVEVMVHSSGLGYIVQRATRLEVAGPTMYVRTCVNSVWGAWSPDVFQSGVDAKQGIVNAINAKGGSASMNDDWATLAAKINAINTGKRFATGQFTIFNNGQGSVSGLAFRPKNITFSNASKVPSSQETWFGVYSEDAPKDVYTGTTTPLNMIIALSSGGRAENRITPNASGFTINAGLINEGRSYNYFATE
ncbi:hypothetical protein ABIE27_004681 [Paenibacillus sp. 4624]|uniref:pyocin knob domain-containing protein n=1 Tax=Paenibacillus sp. 4624 TaxID=3156453 RepID=UPI003D1DA3D8